MRTVNAAALELIKSFEKCRLDAYQDEGGIWTCGWGDTGPDVTEGTHWTQTQADARFEARINREFAPFVENHIEEAPTTGDQFGAMVSLAYNIGDNAFLTSSVLLFHRLRNYRRAADSFLLWDKVEEDGVLVESAGLLRRRHAERVLYLTPDSTQENVP